MDCWFVAFVRPHTERKAAEALTALGVVNYLPIRAEWHQWSDRRKRVEVLLIPRHIFVRTDERTRLRILSEVPEITAFMYDRGEKRPSVVREVDMNAFIALVERSGRKVEISGKPLKPGDRVRVVSGQLIGVECERVTVSDRKCLAVGLGPLGNAAIELDNDTFEKI